MSAHHYDGHWGDVSTGVVDELKTISLVCKKYDFWFLVVGAYGIPAAVVLAYSYLFDGIREADSISMDPHKWLYSPLEAGCTLVIEAKHLTDTFISHPDYYKIYSDGAMMFKIFMNTACKILVDSGP